MKCRFVWLRKALVMVVVFMSMIFYIVLSPHTPAKAYYEPPVKIVQEAAVSASHSDLILLAKLIHSEAAGEPYTGKVAVGGVVLNRLRSAEFPKTIAEIIYQPLQFSGVGNAFFNSFPPEDCIRAAREALAGIDPSGGALFHVNLKKAYPTWANRLRLTTRIGDHWFYTK